MPTRLSPAVWDFIRAHQADFVKSTDVLAFADDLEQLLIKVELEAREQERDAMALIARRVERCVSRVFQWAQRRKGSH
jgi:hypothetical protein